MLPGYVPQRGQYNTTYMEVMQKIVSTAAKYGIYTLLDMHQDVMSRKFCVEGFPDWAVNSGKYKNVIFYGPVYNTFDVIARNCAVIVKITVGLSYIHLIYKKRLNNENDA